MYNYQTLVINKQLHSAFLVIVKIILLFLLKLIYQFDDFLGS